MVVKQFYLRLINKFFHQSYLILVEFLILYVRIKVKPANTKSQKRILALPYYPEHYAGGHERIADWKEALEGHGITYDVKWACDEQEYKAALVNGNSFKKYLFYSKVSFRRIQLVATLHHYDAIWIQRGFIPYFPFKDARFAKHLYSKSKVKLIESFYLIEIIIKKTTVWNLDQKIHGDYKS
jgi:hypothetical protein